MRTLSEMAPPGNHEEEMMTAEDIENEKMENQTFISMHELHDGTLSNLLT